MVGRVFSYNSYYSLLVCANYGHRATGMANKDGGRLGGVPFRGTPVPATPYPWGGGKTGGVFLGRVGYISQPFKTTSSEQGVQEKQGGMIFEQVCKK